MAIKPSLPAAAFAKALRSLETGGLSYSAVLVEIRELLAAGASPTELRDTLLGRELIEPLSVQARAEILGLLNSAMLRERQRAAAAEKQSASAEAATTAPQTPSDPGPAPAATESSAMNRISTLETALAAARNELQSERKAARDAARAATQAAADSLVALETALGKADQAASDADRLRTEAESLQDSLDEREATLATLRQSLAKRDAQLATLSKERADLSSALEARGKAVAQLQSDAQATRDRESTLAADLAKATATLESEQTRAQSNSKSLVEKLVATEAALARAEEALKSASSHQSEAQALRNALTVRESELAALQRQHESQATALQALEKKRSQLEADLLAARALTEEASKNSIRFQTEAQVLRDRLAAQQAAPPADPEPNPPGNPRLEAELQAARAQADEAVADAKRHEAEARRLLNSIATHAADRAAFQRDYDKQVSALQAHEKYGAQLETELQKARARADELEEKLRARHEPTQALEIRPKPLQPGPQVLKFPPAPSSPVQAAKPSAKPAAAQASRAWKIPQGRSALGIVGAVIIALIAVWMLSHRTAAPVEEAQVPAAAAEPHNPGTTLHDCAACPTMTVLPAGRFKQGSAGTGGAPSFELPQHWVVIGKPFAMSTTPVTVDQFAAFIAASGREVQGCDIYDGAWKRRMERNWKDPGFSQTGVHPVTCVSSNDAAAYAGWLSAQSGHKYRLPSASEWEYAARAGSEAVQPWGAIAADACRYANVADQSAADQYPGWQIFGCDDAYVNTSPVGTFEANAFGLKDMLGNVLQWTEDCWNVDYTGAPVNGSARTDGDCGQREVRGGSWFSPPDFVRVNYRTHFAADYRATSIGIRVVRELEP
jgi:formylglycine-generating enzyme required for sulfatase activity